MNDPKEDRIKQIASQLLAGMLANPHIYSQMSDSGIKGQLEQTLIILAIEMAEDLVDKVEQKGYT